MKLLRHPVAALVIFGMLTLLFIQAYQGFQTGYGFAKGDLQDGSSIMEKFEQMTMIEAINELQAGIQDIKLPTSLGEIVDVLGGLASVGIGSTKLIIGLVILPWDIMLILFGFYPNEVPVALKGFFSLIVVYVGFILVSLYLKGDV